MAYKSVQNCLKFSLVACFLLLLQPAFSQGSFTEVDDLLTKNQKALGTDFVALAFKDGKIAYKKEVGQDFNIKTQGSIGYCGTWLTAALIMELVDEGKLSLDDPITKYIPLYSSYSKKYITLRHCLTNTHGIQVDKGVLTKKKFPSLEEEAIAYAKKEIERNPGEEFVYSGLGMSIAARVAEIVTKKTFDRLIQDKILRPLKMRQTNFGQDFDRAIDPAGGCISTATDYINFLTMILNKGMFEGKKVLSEQSVAEMQKMQTGNAVIKYVPKAAEGFEYGLGDWIVDKDGSGKATVVACPGLNGAWTYVDYCRGYAFLLFVKSPLQEQRKDIYMTIKEAVDQQMGACK